MSIPNSLDWLRVQKSYNFLIKLSMFPYTYRVYHSIGNCLWMIKVWQLYLVISFALFFLNIYKSTSSSILYMISEPCQCLNESNTHRIKYLTLNDPYYKVMCIIYFSEKIAVHSDISHRFCVKSYIFHWPACHFILGVNDD